MEQSKKRSLSNPITDEEREVSELLLNLPNLIKKSESCFRIPVWGVKGRRSAINLAPSPPHYRRPEKKPKIAAGDSSPATPLSFSPSESDDKTQQSLKIVPKKTREELLETINELVEARESLTRALERVKGYHNSLEVNNKVLKAKQQELQFLESEPNNEQSKKSLNLGMELNQNKTPFPFLLENHHQPHLQFLSQQQQQKHFIFPNSFKNFQYPCNQTHPLPPPPPLVVRANVNHVGPSGIPDLNVSADEAFDAEYLQPSDRNVQGLEDGNRARAAEARKRRMIRVKERKLNLAAFKLPKS